MNALTEDQIWSVLDQVLQEITKQIAEIQLHQEDSDLSGDVCTVYTTFQGSYHATLVLCAETRLLTRLTQRFMQEDIVNSQDVEDFSKEYFNVICGQIVAGLFKAGRISSRFQIPSFCVGKYTPFGANANWHILGYVSDQNEKAQLMHHMSH